MSECNGILDGSERFELVEMARTILSELSKVEQMTTADFEIGQQSIISGHSAFFDEYAVRTRGGIANYADTTRGYERGKFSDNQPPRDSRRQFLEQRIERRRSRAEAISEPASVSSVEATSGGEGVNGVTMPSAREAAERLSEIVCRDTRRYDGAYEKF